MVYRKQDAFKDRQGQVETRDLGGGKRSVRFRDTKGSCNIINHSRGSGVSSSASEHGIPQPGPLISEVLSPKPS